MTARLLIIALDGADGRTLDRASGDGNLPNLARLRARGRAWAVPAPRDATDDSLWASFQYGSDVGEHGRFTYHVPDHSDQMYAAIQKERGRDTFWDRLSRDGMRVAVLDVPKCRPPRPLNGIHLIDWLVHGRYFADGPIAYPEALGAEILSRFGAAPPSVCSHHPPVLDDEGVRTARDNLLRSVGQKRAASLHYLSTESWDLFIIGFKESHCISHLLWEFTDPAHPKYDASRVGRLGNPVLDILKAQDAAIGDLVAAAGPEANIVIFSTGDFVPNGSFRHLMPAICKRINRYIGRPVAQKAWRTLLRLRGLRPLPHCWPVIYSDDMGALRLTHLDDDDDRSFVERLDLVTALVSELVDADDGLPIVRALSRPAFEHSGEYADRLPHLVLHSRRGIFSRAVTSQRLGRIEAPRPATLRTGNHVPGGFAFSAGPALGAASVTHAAMKDFASLAQEVLGTREMAAAASQ